MLALLHFQSHGNRFQPGHALSQLLRGDTQVEGCGSHCQRALYRGLVIEWYLVGWQQFLTMPAYLLAFETRATHTAAHQVVISIVDDDLGIMKQLQLLHALLFQRTEVLLVRSPDRGQHTNGRLYDVMQRLHLTQLTDTSLEQSYLCLFVEQPDRQGDTDLRVVALGRTGHDMVG